MREISFIEYLHITGYFIRNKIATNKNYPNNEVEWIDKNGNILAKRTKVSNNKFINSADESVFTKIIKDRR